MSGESILDGVSEVDVAILSEGRKPYLHSFPDNRDAHTRAEVVEALPRPAGRAMNKSKSVPEPSTWPNQVPHRNEPSFPMTRSRRLSGITRRQLGWRNAGQRSELPGAHDRGDIRAGAIGLMRLGVDIGRRDAPRDVGGTSCRARRAQRTHARQDRARSDPDPSDSSSHLQSAPFRARGYDDVA